MRKLISSALAMMLTASGALAADLAPLPPGHPAGVRKSQDGNDNTVLYVALGAGAIVAIALAASSGGGGNGNGGGGGTTPTTSSTGTTS